MFLVSFQIANVVSYKQAEATIIKDFETGWAFSIKTTGFYSIDFQIWWERFQTGWRSANYV